MRSVQLNTIGLSVAIACVLSLGLISPGTVFAGAKVDICHLPPGNPENFHTITISENALSAHLGHGDFEGACNANCASLCDDGNACTIDDTGDCAEVGCPLVPEPVDCNDSDPTTVDTCDPSVGCINTPTVVCPCEGLSFQNVTWDDSFNAESCAVGSSDDGLVMLDTGESPKGFLSVFIDPVFSAQECALGRFQSGSIFRPLTDEQVSACKASISQIAENDNVTCP